MKRVGAFLILGLLASAGVDAATTYFVAPNGNDDANGVAGQPFKTIQHAADVALPGDTVIVGDGMYRESVLLRTSGTPAAPIKFQAEHSGAVTISGADPIYAWSRVSGGPPIYVTPWDHVFAIDWHDGKPVECHPDDATLWGRAEQVIADDRQLLPVPGLKDLAAAWSSGQPPKSPLKGLGGPFAGWFAVDTSAKKLYALLADGSDPGGHRMQAATRGQTFGVNPWQLRDGVSYVQLKGVHFIYGATFPQRPVVWLHGSHNLIEDCFIERTAGGGVGVCGVLRNCVIKNCGHTGGSAYGDGFENSGDAWVGNCWKPIDRGWDAGGVKQGATKNGIFDRCLFQRNGGPGLWLDVWVHDVKITNCVFSENEGCGLFVEISHHITASHNLAIRNAIGAVGGEPGWSDGGMVLAESEDCAFTDNTCIDNRYGIGFREQGPRDNDTDTGHIAFHDARDTITDNNLAKNRLCQLGMWFDNGFFGRHPSDSAKYPSEAAFEDYLKTAPEKVFDPTKQRLTIDRNQYPFGRSSAVDVQYGVPWRPKSQQFKQFADFAKVTGFEQHASYRTAQSPIDAAGNETCEKLQANACESIRTALPPWLRSRVP